MAFDYLGNGVPVGIPSSSPATYLDKTTGAVYATSKDGWRPLALSALDALTAHAGGGQANGLAITAAISRFTTVATAADSATLPAAKAGMVFVIINAAAANSMNVFPASGEAINALAGDAAFAMAANKTAQFYCAKDGQWNTILTA